MNKTAPKLDGASSLTRELHILRQSTVPARNAARFRYGPPVSRLVARLPTPGGPAHRRLAELQALYDHAPVALGLLDRDLRVISANQRPANFHDTAPELLIGRTVADALSEAFEAFQPTLSKALAGQAISGITVAKPSTISGDPDQLFAISFQPTFDEDEEVIGISIAIMDLG
jgi:PAS domain-containing protein